MDKERREYWIAQMNAAHAFMAAVLEVEIVESFEPMVDIRAAAKAANTEIVFSEATHERGLPRLFWLREGLVPSLLAVAQDLNDAGLILRIEDALRTPAMQANLFQSERVLDQVIEKVFWETGTTVPTPELVYKRLMVLCATIPKTGTHLSGTAVDVSVLMEDGTELDRGGPYIELSERTPMSSPFVSDYARANRQMITAKFLRHGFVAYPFEFWHYSKDDVYSANVNQIQPPVKYGPVEVDLSSGNVKCLQFPSQPLPGVDTLIDRVREGLTKQR